MQPQIKHFLHRKDSGWQRHPVASAGEGTRDGAPSNGDRVVKSMEECWKIRMWEHLHFSITFGSLWGNLNQDFHWEKFWKKFLWKCWFPSLFLDFPELWLLVRVPAFDVRGTSRDHAPRVFVMAPRKIKTMWNSGVPPIILSLVNGSTVEEISHFPLSDQLLDVY